MTMKARWLAGLAIAGALTLSGVTRGSAQQAPAATVAPGAAVGFRNFGGGTFFPNMGAPLGFNTFGGLRPFGGAAFFPNFGTPLGFRSFTGQPFLAGVQAPQSAVAAPTTATPVAPDIRQPQSGTLNPAAAVPFGAVPAGVAGDTSLNAFGAPTASLSAGFNPSVTNPSLSSAFNPAVANPFVPNPALPQSRFATPAPVAVAEQQALAAAQRVMATTPLTEGIVTSMGPSGAQVRMTTNGRTTVTRVPLGQLFFFNAGGQLSTATGQLAPGTTVLVPMGAGQTR
jgi:hypothetical protein